VAQKEKEQSAWLKMLNMQGDQMVPELLQQMGQQAGPMQTPMPEQPGQNTVMAPEPEGPPQLQSLPPSKPQLTSQPTTQPIGTAPQELVPSQPELMDEDAQSASMKQQAWDQIQNYQLPDSSEMRRQMALGEKSYAESQMLQQDEVNRLKESLANYQSQPQGRDLRPLAALSDMWFGGNLSRVAEQMAPESAAQRAKVMSDIQAKIAAAQGQMTKSEMDMMKSKLAQLGYMDERQIKAEEAKMKAMSGMNSSTGEAKMIRALTGRDSLADRAFNRIHEDPVIKKAVAQLQQMDLDLHTLGDPTLIMTPQMISEAEMGLARAIGGGGAVTAVSTQEKVEFNSIKRDLIKLRQRVTNKPTDIDSPEVKAQMIHTMKRLREAYANNIYARAQKKLEGASRAYKNTPQAIEAMKEAVDSYNPDRMKYVDPNEAHGGGGGAPKVGDVVDGYKFLGGDPSKQESWGAQ